MERLINLDPQLLHDTIFSAIAILVLFTLLSYLLFNPARKMLESRTEKIRGDLEAAKADKKDAADSKALYEAKLKDVDKEVEEMLRDGRAKALQNETKIVNDAKEEASRIIKHANDQALLEQKRALDDMKKEMIAIATLMATKVVTASIDTKVQDSLVEETMKEIGERTWLS